MTVSRLIVHRRFPGLIFLPMLVLFFSAMRIPQDKSPLPAPRSGQEPPAVLKVTTRLVTVDVVARDRHGNAVGDLTAADFQITEQAGGHKSEQQIASFRLLDRSMAKAPDAERAALQLPQDVPAGPVGQVDVEQQQVGRARHGCFNRFSRRCGLGQRNPTARQVTPDHFPQEGASSWTSNTRRNRAVALRAGGSFVGVGRLFMYAFLPTARGQGYAREYGADVLTELSTTRPVRSTRTQCCRTHRCRLNEAVEASFSAPDGLLGDVEAARGILAA